MTREIVLFFFGLALIIFGADILVEGASAIARRFKVSEFVIGLTIVGMGTSAPEMVVSLVGAVQGNADIAIGNVVGSNIFNTLLILGVTALILPVPITAHNRKRDIPAHIGVTLLLILLGMDGRLNRADGIGMLLLFALYMWGSFKFDERPRPEQEPASRKWSIGVSVLLILGGLAALTGGGNLFVNSATEIAERLGISEKFIAITILAGGTSAPELATCIVSAVRKQGQLALGNIIGSNIFNILLILGSASLITPLSFAGMNSADMGALLLSALLLWTSIYTWRRNCLDRADGAVLLFVWLAYMAWLVCQL